MSRSNTFIALPIKASRTKASKLRLDLCLRPPSDSLLIELASPPAPPAPPRGGGRGPCQAAGAGVPGILGRGALEEPAGQTLLKPGCVSPDVPLTGF